MAKNENAHDAVQRLWAAHIELLNTATELVKIIPPEIFDSEQYQRLSDALEAESRCLKDVANKIVAPLTSRTIIYQAIINGLEGKP